MTRLKTLFRTLATLLFLSAAAALSGCSGLVDIAEKARSDALAMSPNDGYRHIMDTAHEVDGRVDWFRAAPKAFSILRDAAGELMLTALSQNDVRPLRDQARWPRLSLPVSDINKAVDIAIAKAREPDATASMLLFGAEQALLGKRTMQNHQLAKEFAERAWIANHPEAAALLTQLHTELGATADAYLWSLRCIGECGNAYFADTRKSLRNALSKEEILLAQELSANREALTTQLTP